MAHPVVNQLLDTPIVFCLLLLLLPLGRGFFLTTRLLRLFAGDLVVVGLEDILDLAADDPVGIDIGDPRRERLEHHVALQCSRYLSVPDVWDAPPDLAQSVLLERHEAPHRRFLGVTFPPLLHIAGELAGELLEWIERWWRRRFDEWLELLVARLEVLRIFFERVGDRFGPFDRTGGPPRAFLHTRAPTAAFPGEICIQHLPREAAVAALGALRR